MYNVFSESSIQGLLCDSTRADQEFNNDIYGQYRLEVGRPDQNRLQANIIHPATQKHLDKYLSSPAHLLVETPALYHAVTLPFILAEQFSLDWVYNVLEHKKEADRIIYENTDPNVGFILAPDFKWSGKQVGRKMLVTHFYFFSILSVFLSFPCCRLSFSL